MMNGKSMAILSRCLKGRGPGDWAPGAEIDQAEADVAYRHSD
jgi:hypothetical protein